MQNSRMKRYEEIEPFFAPIYDCFSIVTGSFAVSFSFIIKQSQQWNLGTRPGTKLIKKETSLRAILKQLTIFQQ